MSRFVHPLVAMQQAQVDSIPSDHDRWLEEEFQFVPLAEGQEIPRLVFV
jgi:hypothetical protein